MSIFFLNNNQGAWWTGPGKPNGTIPHLNNVGSPDTSCLIPGCFTPHFRAFRNKLIQLATVRWQKVKNVTSACNWWRTSKPKTGNPEWKVKIPQSTALESGHLYWKTQESRSRSICPVTPPRNNAGWKNFHPKESNQARSWNEWFHTARVNNTGTRMVHGVWQCASYVRFSEIGDWKLSGISALSCNECVILRTGLLSHRESKWLVCLGISSTNVPSFMNSSFRDWFPKREDWGIDRSLSCCYSDKDYASTFDFASFLVIPFWYVAELHRNCSARHVTKFTSTNWPQMLQICQ